MKRDKSGRFVKSKSKRGGKSTKKDMTKCVKCKKIEPKTASEKRLEKVLQTTRHSLYVKSLGFVMVHYCRPCARKYIRSPSGKRPR